MVKNEKKRFVSQIMLTYYCVSMHIQTYSAKAPTLTHLNPVTAIIETNRWSIFMALFNIKTTSALASSRNRTLFTFGILNGKVVVPEILGRDPMKSILIISVGREVKQTRATMMHSNLNTRDTKCWLPLGL